MGHLHRQALVQRAKARAVLLGLGMTERQAKETVNARPLTTVDVAMLPAPASAKKAARTKGKKRGTKKKA